MMTQQQGGVTASAAVAVAQEVEYSASRLLKTPQT